MNVTIQSRNQRVISGCLMVAVVLALGLFSGCGKPHGIINQDVDVSLTCLEGLIYPKKITFPAKLRVESIKILQAQPGDVLVKVQMNYFNKAKDSEHLEYYHFVLCDAEGRKYTGVPGLNRDGNESAYYLPDAWGEVKNGDHVANFIKCEPAMSDENTVSFKLPVSAFSGDVSFGFVSSVAPDDVQVKILVYEKAKSTCDFASPGTFTTTDWK